jgi:hypothetical protein
MADEKSLADLVVGDRFWLGYAQELVNAAVSAPDRRAEQLTNTITWFWSIYSATVLVVLTIRTPSLGLAIPLGLPVVLLIAAYWLASCVRAPILLEFDPRVPAEIEASHHAAVAKKNSLLGWAEIFTGLSAVCVGVAIVAALLSAGPAKPELYGYVGPEAPGKLLFGGEFAKQAVVRVNVQPVVATPATAKDLAKVYRASDTGELRDELDVPESKSYRVTAAWNEDKVEKTIAIDVKRGE